jgi:hypothetical protein
MASAVLTSESQVASLPATTNAAWWRRGHSYAFLAVVALEIAAAWAAVRSAEAVVNYAFAYDNIVSAAMLGFLFAQCFLVGLWAALGGLGTVPRWLLAGFAAALGGLLLASVLIGDQWIEFLDQGPIMALLAVLTAAGFAVVLVPLRRLAGWRVDFDAAYHPATGRRRGQLGMMDFAAMFCAVALPLTLGRSLVELMGGDDAEGISVLVPVIAAVVLATAGPVAYVMLSRRGVWLRVAVSLLWVAAVCVVHSFLAARFPDLDLFDGRSGQWGVGGGATAFHGSVAVAVALPLVFLRCWGLKLLVVTEKPEIGR